MREVTMTLYLKRMPSCENTDRIRLVIEETGVRLFLHDDQEEGWIEVSDEGELVVRGYHAMEVEDDFKTMTIGRDEVVIS